jgi:hypothetical protein
MSQRAGQSWRKAAHSAGTLAIAEREPSCSDLAGLIQARRDDIGHADPGLRRAAPALSCLRALNAFWHLSVLVD